ncbi:MAG TPA: response regulator [Rectinemataceae bacterium]|nr:response regulator [Rectinemataceae bacterium]
MPRILVVDDSSTSRAIVARLLETRHETVPCADGPTALGMIERETFDAVLLDLLMPGMDGSTTLREIVTRRPGLAVIVITADIQETTRLRVMGLGAAAIVNKPLRRENLLAIIDSVLGAGT